MMAAGRAAERGAKVLLLEKTDGPGKKILISGKSRCNLSNARDLSDFIGMYGPNGRFSMASFTVSSGTISSLFWDATASKRRSSGAGVSFPFPTMRRRS